MYIHVCTHMHACTYTYPPPLVPLVLYDIPSPMLNLIAEVFLLICLFSEWQFVILFPCDLLVPQILFLYRIFIFSCPSLSIYGSSLYHLLLQSPFSFICLQHPSQSIEKLDTFLGPLYWFYFLPGKLLPDTHTAKCLTISQFCLNSIFSMRTTMTSWQTPAPLSLL